MATGKTIRCGVIGYGGAFNMGKLHLTSMSKNRGMQVTAVCEVDPPPTTGPTPRPSQASTTCWRPTPWIWSR